MSLGFSTGASSLYAQTNLAASSASMYQAYDSLSSGHAVGNREAVESAPARFVVGRPVAFQPANTAICALEAPAARPRSQRQTRLTAMAAMVLRKRMAIFR